MHVLGVVHRYHWLFSRCISVCTALVCHCILVCVCICAVYLGLFKTCVCACVRVRGCARVRACVCVVVVGSGNSSGLWLLVVTVCCKTCVEGLLLPSAATLKPKMMLSGSIFMTGFLPADCTASVLSKNIVWGVKHRPHSKAW